MTTAPSDLYTIRIPLTSITSEDLSEIADLREELIAARIMRDIWHRIARRESDRAERLRTVHFASHVALVGIIILLAVWGWSR